MENKLRVCNPFEFRYLFERRGREFVGLFSKFAQDILRAIARASNVTVEMRSRNDQPGERMSGESDLYSGCIGRLQTNQSDAMLFLTEYPSAATNITQGLVMSESITKFISVYYPDETGINYYQIEGVLNAFDIEVWLIAILSLSISVGLLLLQVAMKIQNRKLIGLKKPVHYKHIPFEVVAHMTDHGQLSNDKGLFRKIMFIIFSIFSFLVLFYFSSYVKTDLVVIPPPSTLRSYQQLLNAKCGVNFIGGGDTYQPFKFASEMSIEKRLWNLSVKKYSEDRVRYKYTDPVSFADFLNEIMNRNLSLLTDSAWAPYHLRMMCSLLLNREKLRAFTHPGKVTRFDSPPLPLTANDQHARVSQKSFISSTFKSPQLKRLEKILRRVLEGGIPDIIMKFAHDTDLTSLLPVDGKGNQTFGNMNRCMANELILPEYTLERVNLGNLRNFPRYVCYLVTFHSLVLLVEVLSFSISSKRRTFAPKCKQYAL